MFCCSSGYEMKIELTLADLEEIATNIVVNQLTEEEACDYVKTMAFECHESSVKLMKETLEWT
jgi:hypothetical protein